MAIRRITICIGIAATILLSACATIIDGPRQRIAFESTPPGATVHIDGHPEGTTPTALDLARETSHRVTIHKDGYRDTTLVLNRQFNGMALANLLFLPGLAIDANSGAMGQLIPAAVNVTLESGAGEPVLATQPAAAADTEQQTESRGIRRPGYSERYRNMAEKATEANEAEGNSKESAPANR